MFKWFRKSEPKLEEYTNTEINYHCYLCALPGASYRIKLKNKFYIYTHQNCYEASLK